MRCCAGAAAAIIVPALVALIAENYRGGQQATAIGSLGSARALSGISAFLIGGTLGTLVGWRPVFMIVLALAIAVFLFGVMAVLSIINVYAISRVDID